MLVSGEEFSDSSLPYNMQCLSPQVPSLIPITHSRLALIPKGTGCHQTFLSRGFRYKKKNAEDKFLKRISFNYETVSWKTTAAI